ncbi:MAG: glutamate mutase L [Nocardioides sp.]
MPSADLVVCVDFGSTFTKALLVDATDGRIVATAEHPTTIEADVLDGYDACLARLVEQQPDAATAEVLACSSAGGGLRIAVVGKEELVTAEAGRRVALSSGGKVVLVLSDGLTPDKYGELRAAEPDVVLLVGGTDGGNSATLEADADFLARQAWPGPVVVAGNVESQPAVAARFEESGGTPYLLADNIVPRIGVLAPDGARTAIRELFLSHVIGGKHLSGRADFLGMVRGATPDVVLSGVELLAEIAGDSSAPLGTGIVVVDVGGATTDVHSVVELDPALRDGSSLAPSGTGPPLDQEVVATTRVTRTVEGDLGMRWSAVTTAEAAGRDDLLGAARRRNADPAFLPETADEERLDLELAREATGLALRRHAGRSKVVVSPEGRIVERTGKDLREVGLLVGSGGALRHGPPDAATRVLGPSTGADPEGGWQLPRAPRVVVDHAYVLAAAGLLAEAHPAAAYGLLRALAAGDAG